MRSCGGSREHEVGKFKTLLGALVVCAATLAGCGGGGSSSNVVTVSVSPSNFSVIVTQSLTLTSIVSGTTNTSVTWTCNYVTTSVDSTGKGTDSNQNACVDATGTFRQIQPIQLSFTPPLNPSRRKRNCPGRIAPGRSKIVCSKSLLQLPPQPIRRKRALQRCFWIRASRLRWLRRLRRSRQAPLQGNPNSSSARH